jgi:nitrogen fixation-related uncharacterized protein
MIIVPVIIFAAIILMAISAVAAFTWTARRGEFESMQRTAEEIFDSEEPIGQLSDVFPDAKTREKAACGISLRSPFSPQTHSTHPPSS